MGGMLHLTQSGIQHAIQSYQADVALRHRSVYTRDQLLDEVWGFDYYGDSRTVDVHVKRLRERYGSCESFDIVTVRGLGYKAVKKQ